MESWKGRVALVTGGASGIGRATAERISAAGGSVVVADLDEAALAWTENDDSIQAIVADVTDVSANEEAVALALEAFGRLDATVLNAGLAGGGSIDRTSLDLFDQVLDVNVRAVVLGVRASLAALEGGDAPAIVVTASVSGLAGDPGLWPYNTAKGAAVNFVRAASMELAPRGVRINAVCPGPIHTGMTQALRELPAVYDDLARRVPLGRWGEPREVANVITFLASPLASFMTGAIIPVDGGVMANTGQFPPPPVG